MKRRFFKKKPIVTLPPKFQIKAEYKEKVRSQSYLGKKGYTIPKVILEAEDLIQLKETLLLKPFIPGPQYGGPQEETAFPVYRENTAKIYLPRFFGIERYGLPDRSEIDSGISIDCPFTKDLRDYQHNIINIYLDHKNKYNVVSGSLDEGLDSLGELLLTNRSNMEDQQSLMNSSVNQIANRSLLLQEKRDRRKEETLKN